MNNTQYFSDRHLPGGPPPTHFNPELDFSGHFSDPDIQLLNHFNVEGQTVHVDPDFACGLIENGLASHLSLLKDKDGHQFPVIHMQTTNGPIVRLLADLIHKPSDTTVVVYRNGNPLDVRRMNLATSLDHPASEELSSFG